MKILFFASSNENKIKEVKKIINIEQLRIKTLKSLEIPEHGLTFKENSLIKAKTLFGLLNKKYSTCAEDSGLCIEALKGEPGIYSKRYDMIKLNKKLNTYDKNEFILELMANKINRIAYFICNVTFILSENKIYNFEGILQGTIAKELKEHKQHGFSYDSIFLTENGKRLSELTINEKNQISHRGSAFNEFKNFLLKEFI